MGINVLTIMLVVAKLPMQNDAKKLKNDWNQDVWVLNW